MTLYTIALVLNALMLGVYLNEGSHWMVALHATMLVLLSAGARWAR